MLDTEFIRTRRKKLKLTQTQAAKLAGIATNVHWSRIEAGKIKGVKLDTLAGVAKALRCKVARLLK
jgi:transcriptional regulator with XRE-family HTH domain